MSVCLRHGIKCKSSAILNFKLKNFRKKCVFYRSIWITTKVLNYIFNFFLLLYFLVEFSITYGPIITFYLLHLTLFIILTMQRHFFKDPHSTIYYFHNILFDARFPQLYSISAFLFEDPHSTISTIYYFHNILFYARFPQLCPIRAFLLALFSRKSSTIH